MSENVYKLQCPTCSRRLKISSSSLAKSIVCPRCNARFTVDTQSNSVILSDNELFGPPVSEEFSSGRTMDVGFENMDVEQVVHKSRQKEMVNAARGQATEASSEVESSVAENWRNEKQVQSKLDESLQRNGIGLLILSIGFVAVPFLAGNIDSMKAVVRYLPAVAVVVAFLSSFMLAFSMRRSSIAAILMCSLPFLVIGALSMVGYFWFLDIDAKAEDKIAQDVIEDNDGDADPFNDLLLDKDAVQNNAASKFVPPGNRNRENVRRPVSPDKIVEKSKPQFDVNESKLRPSEIGKSNIPTEDFSSTLRKELKTADLIADNRRKLSNLKTRMNDELSKGLFSNNLCKSSNFPEAFELSKLIGRSSVFGTASYSASPINGFDFCHFDGMEDEWIDLVVPIVGAAEFGDSFVVPNDSHLIGMRFNADKLGILGIQPVFLTENSERVYGPWSGQAASENKNLPSFISGYDIHGFVLYRDQFNLIGIRLVLNSASNNPIN